MANPREISLIGSTLNSPSSLVHHFSIKDNYAYVSGKIGTITDPALYIIDISNPTIPQTISKTITLGYTPSVSIIVGDYLYRHRFPDYP